MKSQIQEERTTIAEKLAIELREQASLNRNKYRNLGLILIGDSLQDNSSFSRDIYYFNDSAVEIFTDALTGATYAHFYCPEGKGDERKEQFQQLLSRL